MQIGPVTLLILRCAITDFTREWAFSLHTHLTVSIMKTTKLVLTLLLAPATLFLYSCESVTNSDPQDDDILTQEMPLNSSSKQAKVEACHLDDEGNYKLLSIAEPALKAHLKHGDGVPGGDVPGMEGFVFDETCTPESVGVEISACFADVRSQLLTSVSVEVDELIFEDYEWTINDEFLSFSIETPLNGGFMRLYTFEEDQCTLFYPLSSTLSVVYHSSEGNHADNLSYLEYLLTL